MTLESELRRYSLARYRRAFVEQGIGIESVQMQDLSRLGIRGVDDCKRFYALVNSIREKAESSMFGASASSGRQSSAPVSRQRGRQLYRNASQPIPGSTATGLPGPASIARRPAPPRSAPALLPSIKRGTSTTPNSTPTFPAPPTHHHQHPNQQQQQQQQHQAMHSGYGRPPKTNSARQYLAMLDNAGSSSSSNTAAVPTIPSSSRSRNGTRQGGGGEGGGGGGGESSSRASSRGGSRAGARTVTVTMPNPIDSPLINDGRDEQPGQSWSAELEEEGTFVSMLSRDEPAMYGNGMASDDASNPFSDDDSLESGVVDDGDVDDGNANEFADDNNNSSDVDDDDAVLYRNDDDDEDEEEDEDDEDNDDENSDSLEFVDDDPDDAVHDDDDPTEADLAAVAAAVAQIVHSGGGNNSSSSNNNYNNNNNNNNTILNNSSNTNSPNNRASQESNHRVTLESRQANDDVTDGSKTRPVTRARDATAATATTSSNKSSRPGTSKIVSTAAAAETTARSDTREIGSSGSINSAAAAAAAAAATAASDTAATEAEAAAEAEAEADAALDRDNVKIRVCVRKRPLGKREKKKNDADVVEVVDAVTCCINANKVAVDMTTFNQRHKFVFDEVFSEARSNEQVYKSTAAPLVRRVVKEGCMATCFAYGQTGAGKTHTMMGIPGKIDGLYLQGARDLFEKLATTDMGGEIQVMASFYEIYCGKLYDLLNGRQELHAREDGHGKIHIRGIERVQVLEPDEIMTAIEKGNRARVTGQTGANDTSSRSHAVVQLELMEPSKGRGGPKLRGRLSFIDLAGSERASDTQDNDKRRRREGAEINTSLLALKECIRGLDADSVHIPFRQSKLTMVLKDSFVGNSRTCMIACIAPGYSSCEHTLNTLRYADRVKELSGSNNGGSTVQNDRRQPYVARPGSKKKSASKSKPKSKPKKKTKPKPKPSWNGAIVDYEKDQSPPKQRSPRPQWDGGIGDYGSEHEDAAKPRKRGEWNADFGDAHARDVRSAGNNRPNSRHGSGRSRSRGGSAAKARSRPGSARQKAAARGAPAAEWNTDPGGDHKRDYKQRSTPLGIDPDQFLQATTAAAALRPPSGKRVLPRPPSGKKLPRPPSGKRPVRQVRTPVLPTSSEGGAGAPRAVLVDGGAGGGVSSAANWGGGGAEPAMYEAPPPAQRSNRSRPPVVPNNASNEPVGVKSKPKPKPKRRRPRPRPEWNIGDGGGDEGDNGSAGGGPSVIWPGGEPITNASADLSDSRGPSPTRQQQQQQQQQQQHWQRPVSASSRPRSQGRSRVADDHLDVQQQQNYQHHQNHHLPPQDGYLVHDTAPTARPNSSHGRVPAFDYERVVDRGYLHDQHNAQDRQQPHHHTGGSNTSRHDLNPPPAKTDNDAKIADLERQLAMLRATPTTHGITAAFETTTASVLASHPPPPPPPHFQPPLRPHGVDPADFLEDAPMTPRAVKTPGSSRSNRKRWNRPVTNAESPPLASMANLDMSVMHEMDSPATTVQRGQPIEFLETSHQSPQTFAVDDAFPLQSQTATPAGSHDITPEAVSNGSRARPASSSGRRTVTMSSSRPSSARSLRHHDSPGQSLVSPAAVHAAHAAAALVATLSPQVHAPPTQQYQQQPQQQQPQQQDVQYTAGPNGPRRMTRVERARQEALAAFGGLSFDDVSGKPQAKSKPVMTMKDWEQDGMRNNNNRGGNRNVR